MQNTPLSSLDQSKILVFALLLIPMNLIFVGIIPTLFILFSVFMMRKNSDFSYIETAAKIYKIYIKLAMAIITWIAIVFYFNEYSSADELIACAVSMVIAVFFHVVASPLFFTPLQTHREWVEKNGIFTTREKKSGANSERSINITGGEKLRSFSVADELMKWAKLRDDGLVSEDEFEEARKKLLQRT